jgi:hypothetical protein
MRYCLMSTALAVYVPGFMPAAWMAIGAIARIFAAYRKLTLIHMPLMRMVQMPVMQIIDMPFMSDRRMTAPRPMLMFVILVYMMCHLINFPFIVLSGVFSVECASALKIKPETCWSVSE